VIKNMKTLTIRWQRLLNENDQTCPRCGETGETIKTAFEKLKKPLAELNIEVELNQEALDFSTFTKDPLQSNCIWINGKLVEEWIGDVASRARGSYPRRHVTVPSGKKVVAMAVWLKLMANRSLLAPQCL